MKSIFKIFFILEILICLLAFIANYLTATFIMLWGVFVVGGLTEVFFKSDFLGKIMVIVRTSEIFFIWLGLLGLIQLSSKILASPPRPAASLKTKVFIVIWIISLLNIIIPEVLYIAEYADYRTSSFLTIGLPALVTLHALALGRKYCVL